MSTALYQSIWGDTYQVSALADFPTPSGGIITLPAGTSWQITGAVDIGSNRIVCAGAACIYGSSPETCTLTGEPGTGNAIVSATASLTIHKISITTPADAIGLEVDGTGGGNVAVDWSYVNFYGAGQSVVLNDVTNAIMNTMAWLGADGISVLTDIDTLAVTESLWSMTTSGQAAIDIDASASINRRIRVGNSVIVAGAGATGISASTSSVTITESLQLERVNFSGSGTFLDGIDYLDDEARFSECRGIINSTRIGGMSWTGNATVTTIASSDTPVKAAATSSANALNQRFAHTDNRLTYASAIPLTFYVGATLSLTSGNNRQIEVLLYKNGTLIPGALGSITTNGSGRAEGAAAQGLVELEQDDYVELWVSNTSNTDDITVTDANIIIRGS